MRSMERIQVHGLALSYSEDFHLLDEAERVKLRFAEEGEGVCLSAPERHILISASCQPGEPLLPRLLGSRELAAWRSKKPERPTVLQDYKLGAPLRRCVGGKSADGFSYTYTASGIPMYGETLVVRLGRAQYYLHFYARQALKEASLPVWEDFLAAAGWE